MENSIEVYQVSRSLDWDTWGEQQRKHFAFRTLREWIASDKFKWTASYSEIYAETVIGRELIEWQSRDQYWKSEEYQQVWKIVKGVIDFWKESKWVCEETTRKGRPRKVEHSGSRVSKAMKYVDLPFVVTDGEEEVMYRSVKWSRRVLGESSTQAWVRLVILNENLFKEVFARSGVEHWTGRSKEEIAESLGLTKKFVNEMCRWLVESGDWKIVNTKREGKSRRELRISYV